MVTIIVLRYYMAKKNRLIQERNSNNSKYQFRGEACTVFVILLVFNVSYFLRVLVDANIFLFDNEKTIVRYMVDLLSDIFVNIIPLTLILLLHKRNFTQG